VLNLWGPEILDSEDIHQLLQTQEPIGSPAFAKLEAIFRDWYAWTVDLPGTYYLEVIERLYKRNELATGNFVALGQTIDLANVRAPVFLLAARDDELVAPAQLFATERLINTPPHKIRKDMVPCRHVGLFMGRAVLNKSWPRIVRWIVGSDASENAKPQLGSVSQRR
jgi:poly(3-hydroxyalkanoate) synthetase